VIVADGEVHPTIDRLLSDAETFPELSFEYHRHRDLTFSDFYQKLVEAIGQVQTRYAMMSDNDDFCVVAGIKRSIAYLDGNSDFVCAGGPIPDFAIAPDHALPGKVIGRMLGARFGYTQECCDISRESARDRILEEIKGYQVIYYHVHRTPALRKIFEENEVHDFSDLVVMEHFAALRAATLGKIRSDPSSICYFRQRGTSMLASYLKNDWVHYLLHTDMPRDYRTMAFAIAREIEQCGEGDTTEFSELILDEYADKLRHMLGHTMLRHRFPRLFRLKQRLAWLREIEFVPPRYQRWLQDRKFWSRLSGECDDATLVAAYRSEFGGIETALRGEEFLAFVRTNAPELMTAES
jgi:glycosyltransferase domain-containing protein